MSGLLIVLGIVWLIIKLIDDAGWNTNAYDNKEYDVHKAFEDACCKRISKSEFKKNYRNGKYSK